MSAKIVERQENSVTIEVTIQLTRSMLDTEETIQKELNEAGCLASAEALKQFDTDGSALLLGCTALDLQRPGAQDLPDSLWGNRG